MFEEKEMHNRKNKIVVMALLVLSVILLSSTSTFVGASQFPILPSTPVTLSITPLNYGQRFPFGATLSDFPSGTFSLGPGTYTCWCIDLTVAIDWDVQYSTRLYSSLAPPYNFQFSQTQLNMVNYILNNKPATATGTDIQIAIWLALGFSVEQINQMGAPYPFSVTPEAQAIYNDALANKWYRPDDGDIIGIICIPKLNCNPVQPLIIEIELPQCTHTCGTWNCGSTWSNWCGSHWGYGSWGCNYNNYNYNYWHWGSGWWGCR